MNRSCLGRRTLDDGARWRHLANTTKRSALGDEHSLVSNCLDHLPAFWFRALCPIHTTRQTRQDRPVCVMSGGVNWVGPTARQVRFASECVRRSHRQCLRRPTHSDAERTCRAVGPTQFTLPHQTRQDGPVCVVSGVAVCTSFWIKLVMCKLFDAR